MQRRRGTRGVGMMGEGERKLAEKRIDECYMHISSLHKECNHYVRKHVLTKSKNLKKRQSLHNTEDRLRRTLFVFVK